MNNRKAFYFSPIALFTVLGLFSSMVHYHSEGLECLEHAEEAHIVESEVFCPISTLVTDDDFIKPIEFDAFITFDSNIFYQNDQILKSFTPTKLGRSPPEVA